MKKQSAAVLDEADDFEARLRWLLFKVDQAKVLYPSEDPEVGPEQWRPGIPIYKRPSRLGYVVGQLTIRPMIQDLPEGYFHTPEAFWFKSRCHDCEVFWEGADPCWVCGAICLEEVNGMMFLAQMREMGRGMNVSVSANVDPLDMAGRVNIDPLTASMELVSFQQRCAVLCLGLSSSMDELTEVSTPAPGEPIYWTPERSETRGNLIEFPDDFDLDGVQNAVLTPEINPQISLDSDRIDDLFGRYHTVWHQERRDEVVNRTIIVSHSGQLSSTGDQIDAVRATNRALLVREADWERSVNRSRRDYRG